VKKPQPGHWKSAYSSNVTGALGLPRKYGPGWVLLPAAGVAAALSGFTGAAAAAVGLAAVVEIGAAAVGVGGGEVSVGAAGFVAAAGDGALVTLAIDAAAGGATVCTGVTVGGWDGAHAMSTNAAAANHHLINRTLLPPDYAFLTRATKYAYASPVTRPYSRCPTSDISIGGANAIASCGPMPIRLGMITSGPSTHQTAP
jgi:hypothetical protein